MNMQVLARVERPFGDTTAPAGPGAAKEIKVVNLQKFEIVAKGCGFFLLIVKLSVSKTGTPRAPVILCFIELGKSKKAQAPAVFVVCGNAVRLVNKVKLGRGVVTVEHKSHARL